MCKDCGCSVTLQTHNHTHSHHHYQNYENPELKEEKTLEVLSKILSKNDHEAEHNREHFNEAGVLCINLMSSPGSGKTTLLENTLKALKNEMKISVIEGDLESENDAKRVREAGAEAFQITTGQSCHLDAFMVHEALHHLSLKECDLLFIENVGNLVCPASYDLGQHLNVVLLSVTEGSDKPQKYPVMFKKADLVIISKADLATGTNLELWYRYLRLKRELF